LINPPESFSEHHSYSIHPYIGIPEVGGERPKVKGERLKVKGQRRKDKSLGLKALYARWMVESDRKKG
jgi:hypothetical protein